MSSGSVGGNGGFVGKGGDGGVGQGAIFNISDGFADGFAFEAKLFGGKGGKGGMGSAGEKNAGKDGDSEDTKFIGGRPMREELESIDIDPEVQLNQLGLSVNSYSLLIAAGYENVRGLLEATWSDLHSAGLQPGEIDQLKYALKKYALA